MMSTEKNFRWTAIFLIKGAADNVAQLSAMLTQLASARHAENVAVVCCINIRREITPDILRPTTPGPGDTTVGEAGWTTRFYHLEKKEGGFSFTCLREDPQFHMDQSEHITAFFREVVLSLFAAEHYILFTWDHGQPFGLFPAREDETVHPAIFHFRLKEQLDKEASKGRGRSITGRALEAENDLPILTVTELKQGIQQAFDGQKIDVMVMSNCYLQFFDTGFELSSCVDYLVAFETQMYFRDGFDYKMILEIMSMEPGLMAVNLAKSIVRSYAMDRNPENMLSKNTVALFANDLSWYPVMAKLIDDLASELITEMRRYRTDITAALDKCEFISPNLPAYCLIDFRNFIRCLHNEAPALFRKTPYAIFENILGKLVVASYIGNDFVDENESRFVAPSCFSVYLPKDSGDYLTYFLDNFMQETSLSPTEFVKRFRWEAFINRYIDLV